MKRIILLFAATVLILVGCSEAEDTTSNVITSEYIEVAHDKLENYTPSDESSEIESSEEASISSEVSDISDSSNIFDESDIFDIPESSDISEDETSDMSDFSETSTEESKDESFEESKAESIFLITVDIAYDDGATATLVCTSDGEIDLYFGNGTEFTNMEEKEDCREKAEALFAACTKYLQNAVKVEDYPFPTQGYTYVYMKTASGIYKIAYTNTEIHLGMEGEIEICVLNTITRITKYAQQ